MVLTKWNPCSGCRRSAAWRILGWTCVPWRCRHFSSWELPFSPERRNQPWSLLQTARHLEQNRLPPWLLPSRPGQEWQASQIRRATSENTSGEPGNHSVNERLTLFFFLALFVIISATLTKVYKFLVVVVNKCFKHVYM